MTERLYLDIKKQVVATEQEVREVYYSRKDSGETAAADFDRFIIEAEDDYSLLEKGSKQFNSEGGNNPAAARLFAKVLEAHCRTEDIGCDIEITIDGYTLQAYDQAALLQSLVLAVEEYADELE